jgi:PAS domain S-box-containing protein
MTTASVNRIVFGAQKTEAATKDRAECTSQALISGLLLFIGCYFGIRLALALMGQSEPVPVIWPPAGILLAALLLNPLRVWWFLLASGLAAHLGAGLQTGVPFGLILSWFLSSAVQGLIGVAAMRVLIGHAPPFSSVRHTGLLFFCTALLAPFLTSFLDAWFVSANSVESSYWELWQRHFCTGLFTASILIPAFVMWGPAQTSPSRSASSTPLAESSILFLGLLSASAAVFWWQQPGPKATPFLFYVPLPFLIWASLRLSLRGVSMAILMVALVAITGAVQGRGPFPALSAQDNALSVQLFFAVVSVTVMLLATSIAGREKAQERFVRAFHSTPDAIIISRLWDGRIIEVNDRWEELFGYARHATIGRTLFELNIYAAHAGREQLLSRASVSGRWRDLELSLRTKSGEVRDTLLSADIDAIDGERFLILTVRDITDGKRTVEQERARIAADIHDDLGARLIGIKLLSDLSRSRANNPRQVRSNIHRIANHAQLCTQSLDEIVWAVSPQQDSLESFINYVQAHVSEVLQLANVRCRFQLPSPPPVRPLSSKLRHNLFLACKEVLNNIVKHSGATEVSLHIQFRDETLTVRITDNGRGFLRMEEPALANHIGLHGHNGLWNLRRRLESVGGRFEIMSQPKLGTTVTLSADLRNAEYRSTSRPDTLGNGNSEYFN